jgi:predicted PurR-regulated permease PerM
MNRILRYTLLALAFVVVIVILWFFKRLIAYILISAVLMLVGRPLVDFLGKLKIGKLVLPLGIRAGITLVAIWAIVFFVFRFYVPLITNQAEALSKIDVPHIISGLQEPIVRVEALWQKFGLGGKEHTTFQQVVSAKVGTYLNTSTFSNAFGSVTDALGSLMVALFSVSFITFFFLREPNLLTDGIILFVPRKNEESVNHIMSSIRKLLTRYFLGMFFDIFIVMTLLTVGLCIAGLSFQQAIVIASFAGLVNVIPYVGPVIGIIFGLFMTMVTHLQLDYATQLLPLMFYTLIVFLIVQILDMTLFQPNIYAKSVKAHPLEIFLVISIAGSLAGITGMLLAIPGYTILRIFAKEFFNNFKLVKKITENL